MGELAEARIAFVGGGIMAEAFLRGMLNRGLTVAQHILVSDPVQERRAHLAEALGVQVTASNTEAIAQAHIVLLAVKPQVLGRVLDELACQMRPDSLLLSIVAGARLGTIRKALNVTALVRIMPNTPGQVGEGISVWTATPETTPEQRQQAREIVAALGEEVYVEHEDYLDMATALSGSGPAYVFLFIEALIDAGVQMGFPRPIAEKLVLQTVRGSAIFAQKTRLHPAILRNMVTSPGGTTAEGLYQLEQGGLRATLARAVAASYQKAQALGSLEKK